MVGFGESVPFAHQALLEVFLPKKVQVWIKEIDFQGYPTPHCCKRIWETFYSISKILWSLVTQKSFAGRLKGLPEILWSCCPLRFSFICIHTNAPSFSFFQFQSVSFGKMFFTYSKPSKLFLANISRYCFMNSSFMGRGGSGMFSGFTHGILWMLQILGS